MNVVCEVCGDVGFKHLLLSCSDCQGGHTHQYCLDKILYDASSVDWFCKECDQRHSEDGKVSSERLSSDVHFVTTPQQPVTKRLESARVFGPRGQRKHAYLKKKYSSRMNYLRKKLIRKNTNMEGMAISRRRCRDASIAGTRVSALHSCEVIGTETTKNKDRNDQVDNEKSVQTLNNDHGSNSLTPGLKQINQLKPHNNISSERPESQTAPFEGFFMKTKKVVSGSLNPIIEEGNSEREKSGEKSKCMNERKILAEALERSMVAANGPQPFTPQNGTFDKAMSDLSNMGVLPKENNCLPRIENGSVKENHCGLLDQDNSTPSVKISSKAIALEVSATEVEISHDVENFGKDKPRKRRLLILDDDDEVDEEKAEDVQKENVNPQPPKYDAPMTKHRVDTEYFVEETVQTGELNDQNLINGRPVKRRRRYIAENEDEEEIVESDNVECALNDATNQSLNDGANMVPQTLVATDHSQQSRPSHSEYDDQEYYIYSQPLDEPVWSGVFKIDSEVLMLDAHLSSKACDRVRELSTSLRSVVEVKKLPRSQAWPKSWTSFGPTDDNIGLFFFPNSLRQNEVSNRLVNNIIKSDGALKVAVGMAELLIFPSSLLPKEFHSFKVNSKVSTKMDAHLSNIACQEVREFSKSLQPEPVLEAKKLPWLHVLPKRWKSSGPTDDCIRLFFFPHTFRPNEVSNELVSEIIKSDSALKITVGVADLLIFPSTILPEQNHLYQGKHYLWGVFKLRKFMSDKGVEDREQDGSARATEECKQQEHNIFDQQDGSTCASEEGGLQEEHLLNQLDLEQHKSSDQETTVMDHVENQQLLVECNSEAQMEAMKSSMIDFTLPGYSLSHAKPNSNCSMSSERTNQQEGITYSPEFNGPSAAEPSAEGDHSHEQSCSGSEPPTTRLFGVLVAQTPRAQQLFQEMANEGALLFPVQKDNSGGVASGMNPDYQHLLERCQPFDFISAGLDERPQAPDAVAFDDSCLELFPARQEQIGWAPGPGTAEASIIDLGLSLAVPARPNLQFQL